MQKIMVIRYVKFLCFLSFVSAGIYDAIFSHSLELHVYDKNSYTIVRSFQYYQNKRSFIVFFSIG